MSKKSSTFAPAFEKEQLSGAVVQLVRIPACHAVGREFESRPHRKKSTAMWTFLCDGLKLREFSAISFCRLLRKQSSYLSTFERLLHKCNFRVSSAPQKDIRKGVFFVYLRKVFSNAFCSSVIRKLSTAFWMVLLCVSFSKRCRSI